MEPFPYRAKFHPSRTDPCFCGSGQRFKSCCGSRAPDRPLPHGIGLIRDYLDADSRHRWLEVLERQPCRPSTVLAGAQAEQASAYVARTDARRTGRVEPGPVEGEIQDVIRDALLGPVADATGRSFEFMEPPEVLRYGPGDHFEMHADSERYVPEREAWRKIIDRDISLLLYLNDDFSGGRLVFAHFGYEYRPKAGDLVWFPSDHRYLHRAHPVDQGVRWVIACWAAFRDEPRVGSTPAKKQIEL